MPIWCMPDACWASSRASGSRKVSASSLTGTRRFMDVSPERLVEQANERFQLQDYYGAIHLLEEVIATGRAFADAHHLLGLSYSLAGQPDKALEQLDRALALNPNYIEALIHRALVLNELGREEEANAVLRRARQVTSERRAGFHGHVAAKLANQHAVLGQAARAVWEELRARRPEDPRVEAYLALLSASDVTPVSAGANVDGLEASDHSSPPARKKKKR